MREPLENWSMSEQFLTRAIQDLAANGADEERDLSPFTTESIVPWAVVGVSLTLCFSAVMGLAAAMVGLSITLMRLKPKGIGSDPGKRHA